MKSFRKKRLQNQFFFVMIIVLFLPLLTGNVLMQVLLNTYNINRIRRQFAAGHELLEDEILSGFNSLDRGILRMQDSAEFHDLWAKEGADLAEVEPRYLREKIWNEWNMDEIIISSKEGQMHFASFDAGRVQDWEVILRSQGPGSLREPMYTIWSNEQGVLLSASLAMGPGEEENRVTGFRVFPTDYLERLSESLNMHVALIQGNRFLMTSLYDEFGQSMQGKEIPPELRDFSGGGINERVFDWLNTFYNFEIRTLEEAWENFSLGAIVLIPVDNSFQLYEILFWALSLFFMLMVILLSLYLTRVVLTPVKKISEAFRDLPTFLANNKRPEEIQLGGTYEMSVLAEGYNSMVRKVFEYRARLGNVLAEINEQNTQLLVHNRQKDDFLAETSHEIRTPLNGIIGIARALLDQKDDNPWTKNLDLIHKSGLRLKNMVNDILDYSKLKNTTLLLNPKIKALDPVLNFSRDLAFPLLAGKPVDLKIAGDRDLVVLIDEDRTLQILQNLLQNAIRFTKTGDITLEAEEQDSMVEIRVRDTGTGIAEENRKRVFEAFEQENPHGVFSAGGTGLGLTIAKNLVELQGGTISLTSQLGKGTTISFTVPKVPEKALLEDDPPMVDSFELPELSLQSASFLLVDDEPINARVVEHYLKGTNIKIDWVISGEQAMKTLEDEKYHVDLVLLDLMLPGISGTEVARRMSALPFRRQTPIIFVTAKDLRALNPAKGLPNVVSVMEKPLDKGSLFLNLNKIFKA